MLESETPDAQAEEDRDRVSGQDHADEVHREVHGRAEGGDAEPGAHGPKMKGRIRTRTR